MCVAITTVLPPHHQSLLGSAGSTGTSANNEVVEQSCASMYIETAGSTLVDHGKDRVPCIQSLPADVGVLVVRVSNVLVTGDMYQLDPLQGCAILLPPPLRYPGGCPSYGLGDPTMIGEGTFHGLDGAGIIASAYTS